MGGFQEMPQVEATRLYTKYAARPSDLEQIPMVVDKAMRTAALGRPGACYVDLPANLITGAAEMSSSQFSFAPIAPSLIPKCQADPQCVQAGMQLLLQAKRPLIIVGKGAAYALRTDEEQQKLLEFVERTGWPVLPTPMGKGLVPDGHPQIVSPARSLALKQADAVLVLGARLNWMLHFAREPRWNPAVRFVKVDVCPEELGDNTLPGSEHVHLWGHIALVVRQLCDAFPSQMKQVQNLEPWWKVLRAKMEENAKTTLQLCQSPSLPMNYYRAFYEIKQLLPRNAVLVSEGANTMDIGRTILDQQFPRSRLDAGSFGTMGVGFGFAMAAQIVHPDRRCVCIQGDSAFGFSAMDYETVCRLGLPIVFVIINNNGIYSGIDGETWKALGTKARTSSQLVPDLPSTALLPDAGYEKLADAFGGCGYLVKTPEELKMALREALDRHEPCIINVLIEPTATRKPQEHSWLTRHEKGQPSKL